jgi:dipeptidyl aminopeptidase/acylaminoacyl peptidase
MTRKVPAILLLACAALLPAQGLPPLIDRELLFGNPEIAGGQISPDGKYLSFLKPWNGTLNIWVKKIGEPFSAARLLTTEAKRPVPGYGWTWDGKYVAYVKDNDGDENYNLYAVDPAATPAAGAQAPPSRDLTGLKGVRVVQYSAPKNDPDTVYIGINDRDKAWHDLYKLKISTGEKTLVRKNTEKIAGWFFDLKGQLRMAVRTADNGDTEILRTDPAGFTRIYSCNVNEGCGPHRFHKDGQRVYLETNKGDAMDLTALMLLDVASGKTELVESDPVKRADLGTVMFSEVTDELVLTTYTDERTRRYFHDKTLESDYKWLEGKLPGMEIGFGSRTVDENLWLVSARSDTEPSETYLYNRKAKTLVLQYKLYEKLSRQSLTAMQVVKYKSSDGLEIPAFLTLPKGVPAKGLPMLLIPHGGPWARDNWGYNPLAQFFANRGYAVLMPNFRGSTGYGKKYLNAGNGEWGRKMQDDLTWGVKYLVAEGIADPKRVGILGGSYGGYAVLAGVAFTPDVYRAAVDIVGPSNLPTLLDAIPAYWEAGRKQMYARMADPGTPAGQAWLKERSPLNSADKIKTALMVVQGANDPRVNRSEAERIVIALRDRNFPVEYLMAPDEGHGFARPVNNSAMFMAAERFLAKHLDGRYQADGTPEVVKRLSEITVDPKTVTLSKKVEAAVVGVPKPAVDLKPGTFKYQAKIAIGGQEIPLGISLVVKEEGGGWSVAQTMETPQGPAVQTVSLEKGTLIVRKMSITQGPVSVVVDFAGGKASGKLTMGGQDRPVEGVLGGELFADSASQWSAIGCLPLAEGYSATFRNFSVHTQKVKLLEAKVAGVETVTVPAGKFETWKVEIAAVDGGADRATLWVAKESRATVKSTAVMSSAGGATMSAELLP